MLLIPFVAKKAGKAVDRLSVVDMSAELIRLFLVDLETSRRCAIITRNQRLAAIHALARFVGEHTPSTSPGVLNLGLSRLKSRRPELLLLTWTSSKWTLCWLPRRPNGPRAPGPSPLVVPLRLRCPCQRGRPVTHCRPLSERFVCDHPGQGRQEASVPAVVSDHSRPGRVDCRTFLHRSRLFESLWLSPNALRHPHADRALRG